MASLFSLNCTDDRRCIEAEIEGLVTVPILRCDDTTPIYSSYFRALSFRFVALDVTKRTVATGQLHCNSAEVITSSYLFILRDMIVLSVGKSCL